MDGHLMMNDNNNNNAENIYNSTYNIGDFPVPTNYNGDFNPNSSFSFQYCAPYRCACAMNNRQSNGASGGVAGSRIPRGAARPRKAPSPRTNFSFQPVFHERSNDEDNAVLSDNLWKLARKTGTLNLTNKGMARVPARIYDINDADEDSRKASLEELSLNDEDAWWNQVPLNNLDLSSNALTQISPKIENLLTLTVLQLHDNALVELPAEIGKLEKLVRLNLSHNKLADLPVELYSLPELRHLNISHNKFVELNPDISNLHMLEFLDASNNNISGLPGGIGFLVRLIELLLSNNHIKELPPDIVYMRSLQKLDLMKNDLTALPEDMGLLRKLQCLYIQHNDVKELPTFEGNETLSELHASNNFIERVPKDLCANLPHLKIFDLRDNKIAKLPDELCLMRNLNRLDISNNSISMLPVSLSTLAHLISLQVEGNPIKTIRRDILQCGTTRILKTLQDRAQTMARQDGGAEEVASGNTAARSESSNENLPANMTDKDYQQSPRGQGPPRGHCHCHCHCQSFMQHQHVQQQHQQQQVQSPVFPFPYRNHAAPCQERQDHAEPVQYGHRNQYLYQFPYRETFFNGQYGPMRPATCEDPNQFNRCAVKPRWIYKMRHTHTLAVNLEGLTDVPAHVFQLASEENVTVVDFARNRLTTMPAGLQHMNNLLTELVLAHNAISSVPSFISQFTRISLLNLSNNQIRDLPDEFGVLDTLRELNISNNRLEILPKGLYELQGLEILIANDNRIKTLNVAGLECIPRLNTLDLRNNDIEYIPPVLGNLTNITHLELVGNPFRQPRHQILMKGTDAIMSYLRDRIPN